jgi:hypothetical protein
MASQSIAPRLAAVLAAALALLVAPHRAAAGAAAPVYGTRDQARQCMVEQERLDTQVQQRQRAHEAHVAALGSLESEAAEITRRQETVDQGNEASVREFNQFVADHNAHVDKINDEALQSSAFADAYNAEAVSHNKRCAGLLIRPEDLAALTRERARAASEPAAVHPVSAGASQAR